MVNQIECEQVGCSHKGHWVEPGPDEPLFCFRTRHDGRNHSVKLTLTEIRKLLGDSFEPMWELIIW